MRGELDPAPTLAAIAALGFVMFLTLIPETRDVTAVSDKPEGGAGMPPALPAGA